MKHPVLIYHELSKVRDKYQYAITEKDFTNHLRFLYDNDYKSLLVDDYYQLLKTKSKIPSKTVLLTFDDGHETNFTVAFPILMNYGFKATFFITTDWIGSPGYMTENQLRELAQAGMSVQSHTKTHLFLDDIEDIHIFNELYQSKKTLEAILKQKVSFLSFPGGRYNRNAIWCAKKIGYSVCLSSFPFYIKKIDGMITMGRYGIKCTTDQVSLGRILSSDYFFRLRLHISALIKYLLRRAIGNRAYYLLWSKIIGK